MMPQKRHLETAREVPPSKLGREPQPIPFTVRKSFTSAFYISMIQRMTAPNITPMAESEKPTKDIWDKLDIVSRAAIAFFTVVAALLIVVAALVIPRMAPKIGGDVRRIITTQTTGKEYMQIALAILQRKDLPEQMQKNIGLRQWAVDLLNYYSPVTLDKVTGDKLISGEVDIPLVYPNSQFDSSQLHDWENIFPSFLHCCPRQILKN